MESEPAIFKQISNFRLGIFNKGLIANVLYVAGKLFLPERHYCFIQFVVFTQLIQVTSIAVRYRKPVLIDGQAVIQWISVTVDYFRIGHQCCE